MIYCMHVLPSVLRLRTLTKFSHYKLFAPALTSFDNRWAHSNGSFRSTPSTIVFTMPPKRNKSSVAAELSTNESGLTQPPPIPLPTSGGQKREPKARALARGRKADKMVEMEINQDRNSDFADGPGASTVSPAGDEKGESVGIGQVATGSLPMRNDSKKALKGRETALEPPQIGCNTSNTSKKSKKTPTKSSVAAKKGSDEIKAFRAEQAIKKATTVKVKKEHGNENVQADPDGDENEAAENLETIKREAARPPPVNSDYLPIPWKGRLGYVSISNSEL